MDQIESILIANDSLDGMHAALDKAAKIERYSGAELHVAEVVYDAIAEEPDQNISPEERARLVEALKAAERRGLQNLTRPFTTRVASLDTRVTWDREAADALLNVQAETRAELLIKPVSKSRRTTDYLHTPLDWAMMRQAPCAVLISKQTDWGNGQCILAAVDVADARQEALTEAILSSAATLAKLLDAELHLACAYPELGQTVNDLQVASDFEGIKQEMDETRTAQLEEWVKKLNLNVACCHVVEGKPATAIAKLANSLSATVTVVGTAARKGLGKLLLGNTAEDIIERVQGDILTVRTSGE